MVSQQEEFVLDVRRAARFLQKPTVLTSGTQFASGETYAKIIEQAHLWLTPNIVKAYVPENFSAWPSEFQSALQHNVLEFRAIAETIPGNTPVKKEEYEKGRAVFEQILSIVGQAVKQEWKACVEKLVTDIEQWCKTAGWPIRRAEKTIEESLLGKYSLPQLHLYADENLYVVDPLARFVRGASAIDLSIQPSFFATSLYRDFDDVWQIHLDVEKGARGSRRVPFSRDSFVEAIRELRALL